MKDSKDKYGNAIDFLFCFRCMAFINISNNNINDDIKCPECYRDDYITIDTRNPNHQYHS